MKPASCKAKGRALCALYKKKVLEYFPQFEDADLIVTSSGAPGEDIKHSPAVNKVLPLLIEAKNRENLNIWQAYDQAQAHGKKRPELICAVVFKKNHRDPMIAMDLEDFFDLVKRKESSEKPAV